MRIVTFTFLLASSSLYPVLAQDNPKPPVSTGQQSADQPMPDNRTVGRDWRVKPNADQRTDGNAGGMSPDSAHHYDQKIDRNWRAEPRRDEDRE